LFKNLVLHLVYYLVCILFVSCLHLVCNLVCVCFVHLFCTSCFASCFFVIFDLVCICFVSCFASFVYYLVCVSCVLFLFISPGKRPHALPLSRSVVCIV
jgi:hypothetical protein